MEWTGARYADKPVAAVSIWVGSTPRHVWALVSDIAVMPRLSTELESVEWLDGADSPRLGARFAGRNAHNALGEWTSRSQIIALDEETVFSWAVGELDDPSAVWTYRLSADGEGTKLTGSVQLGPGPSGLSFAIAAMPDKEEKIVYNRMRELEQAMEVTLRGIKDLVECGAR